MSASTRRTRRRREPKLQWPAQPVRAYRHQMLGTRSTWETQCGRFRIHQHARGDRRLVLWASHLITGQWIIITDFSTLSRAKTEAQHIVRGFKISSRRTGCLGLYTASVWRWNVRGTAAWVPLKPPQNSRQAAESMVAAESMAAAYLQGEIESRAELARQLNTDSPVTEHATPSPQVAIGGAA